MSISQVNTFATVYPLPAKKIPVDPQLVGVVRKIEATLDQRVFCLIHAPSDNHVMYNQISPWLSSCVSSALRTLPRSIPICLLIQSPGGDAHASFRIARGIIRHCGSYTAVIPHYAKSAATLLCLGASDIFFGECAEFGPIDVQIDDSDRERQISALEVVQSLERLNSEAMQVVDAMMSLLLMRTGKRIDAILPHVLKYAADITRPIFDKIDTVSFTFHARLLKIGEDYARMLLLPKYNQNAEQIALTLTRKYPDHGFVIDRDEAEAAGLEIKAIPDNLTEPLSRQLLYNRHSVVGFLEDENAPATSQAQAQGGDGAAAKTPPNRSPGRNRNQRRARNRVGEDGSA